MSAAQHHQPPSHGLPTPAQGAAQNPLLPLPTIALPRITTTRTATHTAHIPRSHLGAHASSSQTRPPKINQYKFACVILPISVSHILLQKNVI